MKNQFVTTSTNYEALKWVALQYLFSPEIKVEQCSRLFRAI